MKKRFNIKALKEVGPRLLFFSVFPLLVSTIIHIPTIKIGISPIIILAKNNPFSFLLIKK